MKFARIQAEQAWPVSVQCAVLGVSRSAFCAWCTEPVSAREARDAALLPKIQAALLEGEEAYGSPRITAELRDHGEAISKGVVERVMRANGITPENRRRFIATTDSKHTDPIAPNLLERCFTVPQPDTVWVTDVTYVATDEDWLYLAVILDLFSRRVVAWAAGGEQRYPARAYGAYPRLRRAESAQGIDSSFRPRQHLCKPAIPRGSRGPRRTSKHEWKRRLLGQRGRRELFCLHQTRKARPHGLSN